MIIFVVVKRITRYFTIVFALSLLLTGCTDYFGNNDDEERPLTNRALYEVFDMERVAELRIETSTEEWNRLLAAYDSNHSTEEYIECDLTAKFGGKSYSAPHAGLRLRGNTSRRRPEGSDGQMHSSRNTNWHHTHFQINASEYVDNRSLGGVEKIALKWFHEDPTYVREIYGYDLYRRFGVWTAVNSSYCRLTLRIKEDGSDAYFGVYGMYEAIDKDYLRARVKLFGDSGGQLWKCGCDASLGNSSYSQMKPESDVGSSRPPYELKTNEEEFESARKQLGDFIINVTKKEGTAFDEWIASVTDIDLLLRTLAVTTTIGHWDDYWGNGNNYYIYFNSQGRFFMIPYDLDNTLGTCQYGFPDGATGDMLSWGSSSRPLFRKILKNAEWRQQYVDYLYELADLRNDYFAYVRSSARIAKWHNMIGQYVQNDTGEDCTIYDHPASWGSRPDYRVYSGGDNTNFFKVRAAHLPSRSSSL